MFLFAVFFLQENGVYYDDSLKIDAYDYVFTIKRAAMQKYDRGRGEVFKRTPVEFDPLENQQCYVVVAFFNREETTRKLLLKNQPKIAGIFSESSKALDEQRNIIDGGFKILREKKEEFVRCEIFPVLITKN